MGEPAKDLDYEDNEGKSSPELHSIEGGGESTPGRANLRAVPDIYDEEGEGDEPLTQDSASGRSHSVPSPSDLSRREAEGYGPGALPRRDGSLPQRKEKKAVDDKTGGSLYRHEGPANTADSVSNLYDNDDGKKSGRLKTLLFGGKGALKNKVNNLSNRNKAILFGVGIGGSGLFILLAILITFFATLKIPNLTEHIATWQFARAGRAFSQSITQDTAEKIAVDSATDENYSKIKTYYDNVRGSTWGKLDKWRPTLTYKNMQATGQIDFQYSDPSPILGRQKLEKVVINGSTVLPEDQSLGRRVFNAANPLTSKEDKILAGKVKATVDFALQDEKFIVRSGFNKKILSDLGVELHWWDKLGGAYRGATEAQADHLETLAELKRISKDSSENSLITNLKEAVDKGKEGRKACELDPACIDKLNLENPDIDPNTPLSERQRLKLTGEYAYNFMSDAERAALLGAADTSTLEKVTSSLSTTAAIAVPACIVYDGSVERSGGTVDNNSAEAIRAFYAIASAGDQQKKGDTTAEAVGATNRKLGDYSLSVPEQRARNQSNPVSTDSLISPQASAAGTFSLIGALFGNAIAGAIDPVAEKACPALTSWQGQAAAVGVEALVAVLTGGGSKEGSIFAQGGVRAGMEVFMERMAAKIGGLNVKTVLTGGKDFLLKAGRDAALIAGGTLIAKMIVLQRMNSQFSGVAKEDLKANIADAGGNLAANEDCRKMLYGRPLTQPETVTSDQANVTWLNDKKAQEGVYQRYFAVSNPDSLITNMGVAMSMQLTNSSNVTKLIADSSTRIGSTILNGKLINVVNPFKKQMAFAQAATTTDTNYQNVQWCWSEDELNLIENNPDYFPLRNDVVLTESGKKDEIEKKYGDCYTKSMGDLFKSGAVQRDENGRVYENTPRVADDKLNCSPKKLSRNNDEGYGDLVFRWRLSKRNNNALDHLTGIQAPTNSDSASANGSDPGGGLGISPDGFVFPQKTTKSKITTHNPAWCYTSQANCHHDYNAADIFADTGTPVVAARGGQVVFGRNQPTGGTGSIIVIKGDDGNIYSYIHLKSGSVKFKGGETVKAGDQLAEVGTNEDAQNTPSHLHFDVQPPPATTREGCTNQACAQPPFHFLNPQPALVTAFNALPDN